MSWSTLTAKSRAEAKIRRVDKNKALKTLKDSMRADLRYAEVTARRHPEQLAQLGWGPRRPRTQLKPPGEVRNIAIRNEGDTWVLLTWEAPDEGGEVAVYRIQRRELRGEWEDVATSTESKLRLRSRAAACRGPEATEVAGRQRLAFPPSLAHRSDDLVPTQTELHSLDV